MELQQNYETLVENDPNPAIALDEDKRLLAVLYAIAGALDELDAEIGDVYDDLFIDSASFEGLEQRAIEVGLTRPDSDSLEQFRTRTRARFGEATSETTLEEFGSIVLRVLDADPQEVTIRSAEDREEPVVIIEADNSVIGNAPFGVSTLNDLLSGAVGAGGAVEIQTFGTFEFNGPNYTPTDGTGFDEGTFGSRIR